MRGSFQAPARYKPVQTHSNTLEDPGLGPLGSSAMYTSLI